MERVLHVLARTPVGGVGSFLINTQNTISSDYIFDYLIIEDVENSEFISFVKSKGSKVFLLNEKLSLLNYINIRNKLKKIIKNANYHIVHLHSPNIATLVLPICKKYNISIRILHSHSTKYSDNIIKSIRNYLLELPMFNYATHLIACSEVAGKFLFKDRKYKIIYNGIDTNRFSYNVENNKHSKYIIGHVGNFVPVKNHEFLIKIFKNLNDINNKYELWLFGDGKEKSKIEILVKKLKLENKIKFYGRVSNIQDYYNKIDVLLLPSLYEGFPVAAMEAQAQGLPIIASINVTSEIDFYGDDVFLNIEEKDVTSWVDAIINTNIKNKKDKADKFKKSKFNIEQTTNDLEQFYNICISDIK